MKRGMSIEYLKCRADLNFEVDFGVNGAIGAIVTKCDLILFRYRIVFIFNIFFLYASCPFKYCSLHVDDVIRLAMMIVYDGTTESVHHYYSYVCIVSG